MKIAILGTRGIPNNHGGFEQFAEYLSEYLASNNHEVFVYNSHDHPFKEKQWNGVNIVHQYDPENKIGTAGQFIYDLNCIVHARRERFDIILQLGYTSSSIWGKLLPNKTIVVTNMDGLEWKRSKYNRPVQKFLKYAEKLAVKTSNFLVADSLGIQSYLKEEYNEVSKYIAYGADVFLEPSEKILRLYKVNKYNYNLLIARLEPENNIEIILDGVARSSNSNLFLVIGKHETKFGRYLKNKFKINSKIKFLGGIYNQDHLNNLRYYSNLYFHGHSVGGTNPSLLEAMASNALIVANENIFNKSILGNDAFYFQNVNEVEKSLEKKKKDHFSLVENNKSKITKNYTWETINGQYEKFLMQCLRN